MYGKLFASTFTGSMMGAGADTFAVWGYVIANADGRGFVELNPKLLAAVIGSTTQAMAAAIATLTAPDPNSRTKDEDGRRIIREGTFIYRIVNHAKHRGMRDEDERRESQRTWVRGKRAKSLNAVDRCRPASTHTEGEEEGDPDLPPPGSSPLPLRGSDPDPDSKVDAGAIPGSGEGQLRAGPVTGEGLKRVFAEVRAKEIPGTLPWQTPVVRDGKEANMAEMINGDPSARADVVPTMELLFRGALAGGCGPKSTLILEKPAFAFATWCSDWTALREKLHGRTPIAVMPAVSRDVAIGHSRQEIIERTSNRDAKL